MPIRKRLLDREAFEPEDVRAIRAAFDQVVARLRLAGRAKEYAAALMVKLAKGRNHINTEELRDATIEELTSQS